MSSDGRFDDDDAEEEGVSDSGPLGLTGDRRCSVIGTITDGSAQQEGNSIRSDGRQNSTRVRTDLVACADGRVVMRQQQSCPADQAQRPCERAEWI